MTWKDDNGIDEIIPAPWFNDAVNGLRLPRPNPTSTKSPILQAPS